MFKLNFTTDNSSFADDLSGEAARILKEIAARIERGADQGSVRDSNGNTIGDWLLETPEEDEAD